MSTAEVPTIIFNNSRGGHRCAFPGCNRAMLGVDDLPREAVVAISQGSWAIVNGALLCESHKEPAKAQA